MRRNYIEGVRLSFLIILPLLISTVCMWWSTDRMLNGISMSVNEQEHARAWEAVRSAFHSTEQQLHGLATDNARWDDAVEHTYGEVDQPWVYDMWGISTSDVNYDLAYVLGPNGELLSGYRNGEKFNVRPEEFLGPAYRKAIADLPGDTENFGVVTSLTATKDGLMAFAISPILPNGEDLKVPASRPNMVLFGHTLKPEDLTRMGEQYIIDQLAIGPVPAVLTPDKKVLTDRWGTPVASVSWKDRRPGDAARASYSSTALAIFLALLLVMLPLAIVHMMTISRLAENEKAALRSARVDALTGLPNRVALAEELSERMQQAGQKGVSLLYVDLDGFKSVNDTYDHDTGDTLLRVVANNFRLLVNEPAFLARLGGDEFAVLASGENAEAEAERIAHALLACVKDTFDINGRLVCIGASIGIASSKGERIDAAELMRRADVTMYDAKARGRNQWRWFNSDLDHKRNEDMSIAVEMRDLVSRGVFEVAYQPIVNSVTREIVGVEALARWPRESARKLDADRFIAVAEEHGVIDDLGDLILEIACRDMSEWQDLRLSVNVSPIQLNNKNFVSELKTVADRHGVDLHRLEVEFTESVLIRNPKRAKQVIAELHEHGVTVALDDFGTGFASVGYLRAFNFDKVKLDRSLTRSILTDIASQKVVQGTVLIADGLSAEIVAEGVETEEEASLMRLSGCHHLQGYYFGRPQPVEMLEKILPADTSNAAKQSA